MDRSEPVAESPSLRPLPIASSILWTPHDVTAWAEADGGAFPIFVAQSTLAAIHEHVGAGAGAASLGLLLGGVFQAPDNGGGYLVVERTMRLPWRVAGDNTKPVVHSALAAVQKELRKSGAQVVGWYHSHLFPYAGLSPNDADTHHALFEPWQIALVVVPREKPLGGVFRSSASDTWPGEPLPFYEWLDDDRSLLSNGRRVTDLPWQNYRTAEDTVPSDRLRAKRPHPGPPAVAPTVTPTAHVLFPDEPEEPPLPGRAWEGGARLAAPRAVRAATYVAGALLGAAGLGLLYRLVARPSAVALGAAAEVTSPSAPDRVDRVADTLALAVAAFDARARLFDHHQMGCPELGRGLVVLEEWWMTYNAARKQAFALDSAHGARDRSLYSDIDAVERRFERSHCPRP